MIRVIILLSNRSFENILSQCIDDNFPFIIHLGVTFGFP